MTKAQVINIKRQIKRVRHTSYTQWQIFCLSKYELQLALKMYRIQNKVNKFNSKLLGSRAHCPELELKRDKLAAQIQSLRRTA